MKLKPIIETLQAIDKGQTCDVNYVCAELTNLIKHMRDLPVTYDVTLLRGRVLLSNAKLALRWGCATTTYYDWVNKDNSRLYFLLRGAEVNAGRGHYPLIPADELEQMCNERGYQIGELCRVTGVARNTIKNWSRDTGGIKRAWDLLEGYKAHIDKC